MRKSSDRLENNKIKTDQKGTERQNKKEIIIISIFVFALEFNSSVESTLFHVVLNETITTFRERFACSGVYMDRLAHHRQQ